MKYSVKVIFGKEQVLKLYNGHNLSKQEIDTNTKEYFFNSQKEKEAFIKGLEEAIGWTEYCIPENELCEG